MGVQCLALRNIEVCRGCIQDIQGTHVEPIIRVTSQLLDFFSLLHVIRYQLLEVASDFGNLNSICMKNGGCFITEHYLICTPLYLYSLNSFVLLALTFIGFLLILLFLIYIWNSGVGQNRMAKTLQFQSSKYQTRTSLVASHQCISTNVNKHIFWVWTTALNIKGVSIKSLSMCE